MSNCHENHVSSPTPVGASGCCTSQASLDHAENGFDLPALAILRGVKSDLHQSSIITTGRTCCWPPVFRRDDRSDSQIVPAVLVVRLGIVTGIGQKRSDDHSPGCLADHFFELRHIRCRATRGMDCQNQMTRRITDDSQLRKPPISRGLPEIGDSRTTTDEVLAAVPRLQSCRVDRSQRNAFLTSHGRPDRLRQQPASHGKTQQPLCRLLKGGEMRNILQINNPARSGQSVSSSATPR